MNSTISDKIRNIRKVNQLTQEEFAEELNISRSKVSSWERTRRDMSITDAINIAKQFNLSLDNFFENENISAEEYIELSDKSKIRADKLNHKIEDGILHFFIDYKLFIKKDINETTKMNDYNLSGEVKEDEKN